MIECSTGIAVNLNVVMGKWRDSIEVGVSEDASGFMDVK